MQISILSTDGVPSEELLDTVRKKVTQDDARVLTDTVTVVSCNIIPIDIYAKINIDPMASQDIIEAAKRQLIEKFELTKGLGWNVTKSWIIANLFVEGVSNVELIEPKEDITVKGNECVCLGNLKADFKLADNDGNTPLHWAASHWNGLEVVKLLIEKGADFKLADKDGVTNILEELTAYKERKQMNGYEDSVDSIIKNSIRAS